MLSTPVRVALVYNQKKEDATQQSETDEATEPPSLSFSETQTNSLRTTSLSFPQSLPDFYAEWDTFETIDAVRVALVELHHVILIEADEDAYTKLSAERPDIVFNIAEGLHGVSREAQIPAMLEMLQIPYTGSNPLTLAICLDKARAKEILAFHQTPTPKFTVSQSFHK